MHNHFSNAFNGLEEMLRDFHNNMNDQFKDDKVEHSGDCFKVKKDVTLL